MAQGKLKVKCKVPKEVQKKKKQSKGTAVTKRNNCPIQQKKKKGDELNKLKRLVTKNVNKSVEEELRSRATPQQKLSNVQKAVADINKPPK